MVIPGLELKRHKNSDREGSVLVLYCLPETDETTGDSILSWNTQDGSEKVGTIC